MAIYIAPKNLNDSFVQCHSALDFSDTMTFQLFTIFTLYETLNLCTLFEMWLLDMVLPESPERCPGMGHKYPTRFYKPNTSLQKQHNSTQQSYILIYLLDI